MQAQRRKKAPTPRAKPVRRVRRSPEELMERILQAATEEFEAFGFAGATTAAIARRADVTEAQLFRYFSSKAELFQAAVFEPLNRHLRTFLSGQISDLADAKDVDDKSRLYITELQHFLSQHASLWMTLLAAEKYAPEGVHGVAQIDGLQTYFERGAATMKSRLGKSAALVSPELMVRVSFASVLGCVLLKDWIFPKGLASDTKIRAAINDFVMNGVNANAQQPPRRNAKK